MLLNLYSTQNRKNLGLFTFKTQDSFKISFHSHPSYLHGLFCFNFTVYSFHENISSHYHVPGCAGEDGVQEENF